MARPKAPLPPQKSQMAIRSTQTSRTASQYKPTPPPMQIVTKGWWVLRNEEATVDEVERVDHEQR
jgi:hypothetical protein